MRSDGNADYLKRSTSIFLRVRSNPHFSCSFGFVLCAYLLRQQCPEVLLGCIQHHTYTLSKPHYRHRPHYLCTPKILCTPGTVHTRRILQTTLIVHQMHDAKKPLENVERLHILKEVLYFADLLVEVPINNHRSDGKNDDEKVHHPWEISLWQMSRLVAWMDAKLGASDALSPC